MNKTTALQRCDQKIREACQRLKELQRVETPYELLALDDPKIAIELQKIKEDIESTKDYLKRMREWRRNSLSKLQRWARRKRI